MNYPTNKSINARVERKKPDTELPPYTGLLVPVQDNYAFALRPISEALKNLKDAVISLELLKEILSPRPMAPRPMVNSKEESKEPINTFEEIWNTLPDKLQWASIQIESFYSFIMDLIYKNPSINGEECSNDISSDYVQRVNYTACYLNASVGRLEYLAGVLGGVLETEEYHNINPYNVKEEVTPYDVEQNVAVAPSFCGVWRDMPIFLNESSKRILKAKCDICDSIMNIHQTIEENGKI